MKEWKSYLFFMALVVEHDYKLTFAQFRLSLQGAQQRHDVFLFLPLGKAPKILVVTTCVDQKSFGEL